MAALDIGFCHLPNNPVFRHSYPMKILEYLACGIPVLASDIPAHREIAKHLKGIYIYRSPSELVSYIQETLSQRRQVEKPVKYSWERIVDALLTHYQLIGG